MTIVRILAILLFFGTASSAQTVAVRTGEHETFTRLAINLPAGAAWRVGRIDGGYRVEIEGINGYNLTDFFRLIPRTRITEAALNTPTQLDLMVACTCTAVVEQWRPNWLLVDIADGAPPSNSEYELRLWDMPSDGATVDEQAFEPEVDFLEDVALPVTIALPIIPQSQRRPLPFPRATISTIELSQSNENSAELDALEIAVRESLARATDQGLIQSNPGIDISGPSTPQPQVSDVSQDSNPGIQDQERQANTTPGLFAQTAVDEALADQTENMSNDTAFSCDYVSGFDVAYWGDDRTFGEQIAAQRSTLTGEFDRIEATAIENLARTYLYFGFGREALITLKIDGVGNQTRSYLSSIARIVDDDHLKDENFVDHAVCQSDLALWAFIAHPEVATLAEIHVEDLALTFKGLPNHLQSHLGARFAEQMRLAGAYDIAETSLQRASEMASPTFGTAIVTSEIALDRGNLAAATAALADLAETEKSMTPGALVKLIDLQISQGQVIPPSTVELLQSMLFEFRDTPEAADLKISEINLLRYQGAFNVALTRLGEHNPSTLPAETADMLRNRIVQDLTAESEDASFLEFAFGGRVGELSRATQLAVAERVLALGFPEHTLALMADRFFGDLGPKQRVLRGEAFVALGQLAAAEAEVDGLDDPRADAIREMSTYDASGTLSAPAAGAIPSTDWREGRWDQIASGTDTLLRQFGQRALEVAAVDDASGATLAESEALLESSDELRTAASELLLRFNRPEVSDQN